MQPTLSNASSVYGTQPYTNCNTDSESDRHSNSFTQSNADGWTDSGADSRSNPKPDICAIGLAICLTLGYTNTQSDGSPVKHAHSAADSIANTTTRWLLRTSP
jgi:hypothetical protein